MVAMAIHDYNEELIKQPRFLILKEGAVIKWRSVLLIGKATLSLIIRIDLYPKTIAYYLY